MNQVYNNINIDTQENLTLIKLEVRKSVFKHMIVPFCLFILIFTVIGFFSVSSSLINGQDDDLVLLLIGGGVFGLISYKIITECLWLLYAKERIELDRHQITIEKIYPVLHFQKKYVKTIQIRFSQINEIKYHFWQQPNAHSYLPKVTDGQIQINAESEKYYIGINLSKAESERVIAAINHHIHSF